ncbi:MAG: hypothetical protein KKC75_05230 [Nanoarchaeota archaeon]|nr:hypothetical protein [Nanoarchaeota archaeon]MBU1004222.1 hypothetical protein [Nanoarchaeota archaeon]MBU1945828.1 hypothetical protein [Nanoarchaeota archaeon]
MPDIFEVDASGNDIFDRGFSIAIVYNNKKRYGFRFPKHLQDQIIYNNRNNKYCIDNPKSLKPRVYSAIVILLLKRIALSERITHNYKFLICEDLYGHFNQISDILIENLKKEFPTLNKRDHISKCRHSKDSLIQKTAHNLYKGIIDGISAYNFDLSEIEEILSKCKVRI